MIQMLKQGILDGDWTKVSRAYRGLTGEDVSPRPGVNDHSDALRRIRDIAADIVGSGWEDEATKTSKVNSPAAIPALSAFVATAPVVSVAVLSDPTKRKRGRPRKNPVSVSTEPAPVEPSQAEPTSDESKPEPARSPFEKKEVECRVCHKSELVHPDLVPPALGDKGEDRPRYKCNDCIVNSRHG
jgi:hypothetical protein